MTRQKSFKRLVRARMGKTGESYTAAGGAARRGGVDRGQAGARDLGRGDPATDRARLGGVVRPARRVGPRPSEREIARWVAGAARDRPLGWEAQAVTSVSLSAPAACARSASSLDGSRFATRSRRRPWPTVVCTGGAFVDGSAARRGWRRRVARAYGHEPKFTRLPGRRASKTGSMSGSSPRMRRRAPRRPPGTAARRHRGRRADEGVLRRSSGSVPSAPRERLGSMPDLALLLRAPSRARAWAVPSTNSVSAFALGDHEAVAVRFAEPHLALGSGGCRRQSGRPARRW